MWKETFRWPLRTWGGTSRKWYVLLLCVAFTVVVTVVVVVEEERGGENQSIRAGGSQHECIIESLRLRSYGASSSLNLG